MRAVAAILCACLLLAGCATKPDTKAQKAAVEARLQAYSAGIRAMDNEGLAAFYAPEGELVNPSRPPVRGPDAIRAFLDGFKDFKVLENTDTLESTVIDGDTAQQIGAYHQKVLSPEGRLFETKGRLEISWVRDASGQWLIAQLATFPEK